jgi:hypothetical protein
MAAAESSAPARPYAVTEERQPCDRFEPTRQPLFGDTHVHTTYSFDANAQDTRNTPADAYRFARGEAMGIQPYDAEDRPTRTIRLGRPLDFTVVTDHAEMLGEVSMCRTPGLPGHDSIMCWIQRNLPALAFQGMATRTLILKSRIGCGEDAGNCLGAAGNIWRDIQRAAEVAYDRSSACGFTSFVGYEWTATVDDGKNLHRNVVFRNAAVPPLPISWVETPSASDLWDELQRQCVEGTAGCDALTIPHNSNLSSNLMFASPALTSGDDIDLHPTDEDMQRRARWEPLVEIHQHKGDSECSASSADEFCGFEALPYSNFGAQSSYFASSVDDATPSFVRHALLRGLLAQRDHGVNSLKFGIIGATDTHIAAPGLTDEKDHPGHGGAGKYAGEIGDQGFPDDLEFSPGGLAVVWAEENSRDSIFSAMQRREVYGTSGTRPIVRFFGGFELAADLCESPEFAKQGYAQGVPMGGDLRGGSAQAPRFAVQALKDVGDAKTAGTPLQRVQIIKGWVEGDATRERVYDVAGGPNGASVDPKTCEPSGSGAARLCSVWTDPAFDPAQHAFYYARVLENPTCRWSQYVCIDARVDCDDPASVPKALAGCCAEAHRPIIQERAWTSPIWYTPPN